MQIIYHLLIQQVHVYNDFEQYRKIIDYYAPSIDDSTIETAICAIGNKGQIVALDSLLAEIISTKKIVENIPPIVQDKNIIFNNKNSKTTEEIFEEPKVLANCSCSIDEQIEENLQQENQSKREIESNKMKKLVR